MLDVADAWLKSGKYAEVDGLRLRPIENPRFKGMPLSTVRGQAQAYYLRDDNNFDWIMKKFLPAKIPDSSYINAIQPLIPPRPGFQAGYRRRVLSKSDISKSGFFSADFAAWVENTVLMSRIVCDDWAGLADKIRKGSVALTDDERILICRSLSEKISLLESGDLSHRDLSAMNVFVEVKNSFVHFIDWDCLFHPSLSMPRNTTYGTEGYVAPFVKISGVPDPQATWRPRADRFSMAILNAEFLCMDAGTLLRNDGGMFEQTELYNGGGPETTQIIDRLRKNFPGADSLLEKALTARSFDDCPSPDEWLALAAPLHVPAVNPASTFAPGATSQPNAAPQANPTSFALLDETAFVRLDESALVPSI
jgi:serine/threonine protein kinase